MTGGYEHILVERSEDHAVITLNRPRALNALSHALIAEVGQALTELGADQQVRAVIVTGSGSKAFAAGADIAELESLDGAAEGSAHSRASHGVLRQMQELPKPVIMAVNGYALGGGCELALGGDVILAAENARFGQPEVNLGIIPGFGGSQRLPRLVGRTYALEMIFTGDHITAEEALRIGLVNHVYAADELLPKAREMAQKIAQKAPLAIALAKRAVYEGLEGSPSEGTEVEIDLFGKAVGTDDRREGTSAFLQKRTPAWRGR